MAEAILSDSQRIKTLYIKTIIPNLSRGPFYKGDTSAIQNLLFLLTIQDNLQNPKYHRTYFSQESGSFHIEPTTNEIDFFIFLIYIFACIAILTMFNCFKSQMTDLFKTFSNKGWSPYVNGLVQPFWQFAPSADIDVNIDMHEY